MQDATNRTADGVESTRFSKIRDLSSLERPKFNGEFQLRVRASTVFYGHLAIIALLMIANVVVHAAAFGINRSYIRPGTKLVNFFDVTHEGNLPAWFQTSVLLLCGLLLTLVGASYLRQKAWVYGGSWALLGAAFCFLSLDEAVSIHETAVTPLRRILEIEGGLLFAAWVIIAVPVLAVFLICLIPFLRMLPPVTRNRFIISGVVFVSGAVALEAIAGAYSTWDHGGRNFTYEMIGSVEELFEKVGIALFLRAILLEIATYPISVHFGSNVKEDVPTENTSVPTPIVAAKAS